MFSSRRWFLEGLAAATALPGAVRPESFAALEEWSGGRIGVAAIACGTGRRVTHRGDEPFPLASTMKLPLVMAILHRVDIGRERLDRRIEFSSRDLEPPYSPIADRYPHGGRLTVAEISALTIGHSDNTGADLLLPLAGGPAGVTAYLRSIGIRNVRLDHAERDLPPRATVHPAKDAGTPAAMAALCARMIVNSPLSRDSTARLLGWMRATVTGDQRLRAGVPAGWTVADKTGTYQNAANDVGLLFPPAGAPIAIACYTIDAPGDGGPGAIAGAAGLAVRMLTGTSDPPAQ